MKHKYVLYFYCTFYKKSSAGVITIHKMIDYFNRNGQPAYILIQNDSIGAEGYNIPFENKLITPLLTEDILNTHINEKKIPIMLYPDTVSGNIFDSENICRLILYYDSMLTGKSSLENANKEGVIFFSKLLQDRARLKNSLYEHIISFPVANSGIVKYDIHQNKNISKKDIYYYDGKFSRNFNGKIPRDIKMHKKIDRGERTSMSQNEVFEVLKKAKLLHVFEDTALIYEALLLGCPVNIHPSGSFYKNKPLAHHEIKLSGSISKNIVTDEDIKDAADEIIKFKDHYHKWEMYGKNQLKNFKNKLKLHNGNFNKKNIYKIRKNIQDTAKYIDLYEKEINFNINNVTLYQIVTHSFFKALYIIHKFTYFRYITRRAYHILPIWIKHKITNHIRRINS